MENLEDKFVAGEWIPPFIEPSPAPKKKKGKTKHSPLQLMCLCKKKPVKKAENTINQLPCV